MARPPKKDAERKTDVLRIRLTQSERKTLNQIAELEQSDTSTWARRILLSQAKNNSRDSE